MLWHTDSEPYSSSMLFNSMALLWSSELYCNTGTRVRTRVPVPVHVYCNTGTGYAISILQFTCARVRTRVHVYRYERISNSRIACTGTRGQYLPATGTNMPTCYCTIGSMVELRTPWYRRTGGPVHVQHVYSCSARVRTVRTNTIAIHTSPLASQHAIVHTCVLSRYSAIPDCLLRVAIHTHYQQGGTRVHIILYRYTSRRPDVYTSSTRVFNIAIPMRPCYGGTRVYRCTCMYVMYYMYCNTFRSLEQVWPYGHHTYPVVSVFLSFSLLEYGHTRTGIARHVCIGMTESCHFFYWISTGIAIPVLKYP